MLSSPAPAVLSLIRPFLPLNPPKPFKFLNFTTCSLQSVSRAQAFSNAAENGREEEELQEVAVSLLDWQGWGTDSPVPAMVVEIVKEMNDSKRVCGGSEMKFAGFGSRFQGLRGIEENKRKFTFDSLLDPQKKLEYFTANQVARRLIGRKGYQCQKCWLPNEDCMCSKIIPCSLWTGIRFWLYMHPKDFLRQNNTGKLLWQLFGIKSATICIYGIQEQEDIMWDTFINSGKDTIWFLYPTTNSSPKSVRDINFHGPITKDIIEKPLNFVLLDGTWNNSAAMYRRLKKRWIGIWGKDEELPCISLSALGTSVMHKLRPQPARDKTCTAAAAAGVLSELHARNGFGELELDKQAEAVEKSLDILVDALINRRTWIGRPVRRKERHFDCV